MNPLMFLCVLLLLLTCPAKSHAKSGKPNFVFVLIDDMGYADLSCFGGSAQTPHIDRIAKEGIKFTQFYCAAPICSPSRTGFLTGQYPSRWGITSFLAARAENQNRGMAQWLDPKAPSLARVLKDNGYATGHFGKWHLGGQRDVGEAPLITEYGFDETLTQFEGLGDRILPLLDAFDGNPPRKYSLGSESLGRGNIQWMERSKVTEAFVDRTMDFIKKNRAGEKPFYVNLWLDDVHSPFFPPKVLRGDNSKRELYQGVMRAMDKQLSVLFDFIRNDSILSTNTIVVFASDNGPEPGAGSAGDFRGHKGMLYEGGIRAPLIVWSPGLVNNSTSHENDKTVVSALDLFPSILSIAKVEKPANVVLDGEDQSAAFLGKDFTARTTRLFWSRPPDRRGDNGVMLPDLAVRSGKWKLLMMKDGSQVQLYNVSLDRSETNNVAEQFPKVTERLTKSLKEWSEKLSTSHVAAVERDIQNNRRN